ncbi:hypothetical protein [Halobaculum limi]|uniref:hypothetical protein n=1 Tax=Halobaculum limi TaxID=3031916 RepID=UPI002406A6D0|nr:hypothetical protein [Halobaculum sp. YSMS11]
MVSDPAFPPAVPLAFAAWFATVGGVAVTASTLAVAYAVIVDARARDVSLPTLWGVASVAMWPIGLYYVAVVARRRERSSRRTRRELAILSLAAGGLVSFVTVATLAPPDPVTQLLWAGMLVPALASLVYVLSTRLRRDRPRHD